MKETKNEIEVKKLAKIFGNVLTILSLLFIVKQIADLEINYGNIFNTRTILIMIAISVVYGVIIIIYCWPWRNYVKMITGTRLPFTEIAFVMAKSNLLKYVPGNIFQYIGRNEIAVKRELKHGEVGMATVLEVVTNLLAAMLLGGIFYFDGFQKVVIQFGKELLSIMLVGIVGLAIVLVVLWNKKKSVIKKYTDILKKRKNIITVLKNLLFFACNALVNAGFYIVTLASVLGMNFDLKEVYILSGAYILAWITGFVIPGAPGGIGIREFVMTLLIPQSVNSQLILLGLVIYRFINILGDVIGFLLAGVLVRIKEK